MASRSLKKVIDRIYTNAKETNLTKRTFNPQDYHVNWERAIRYINAKGKRLQFNSIFKPLFEEIYKKDLQDYAALGHKLTYSLKKGVKQYAKEKAKEGTKAQIAAQAPDQQSFKEQKEVLSEG